MVEIQDVEILLPNESENSFCRALLFRSNKLNEHKKTSAYLMELLDTSHQEKGLMFL